MLDFFRCNGKGHDGPGGRILSEECRSCKRIEWPEEDDALVAFMQTPKESPCPERIGESE